MNAIGDRRAAVRPLRRWSAEALGRVEAALRTVFADWASDWSAPSPSAVCTHADSLSAASAAEGGRRPDAGTIEWHRIDAAPGLAWLGAAGDRRSAMRRLLAPAERSIVLAPLAAALAEAAWTALAARLGERLASSDPASRRADAAAPPESDRRPWSGALVARCAPADGQALWLHLAEPAVRALGAPGGEGKSHPHGPTQGVFREAIAAQRATVRAILAPANVDVGSLLALAPGDILPLAHALDRPLSICLVANGDRSGAEPIAGAVLGARGRRRAVTLLRSPSEETP